ncbi:putative receptor-like protein kinase At5g39000 [Castanea sativa]|uniref:putative receptor-like protein kinase At5g39000 n=1 Tax=Castanea sativa TaxID=21020 RepID=UPI003F64B663
MTGASMEGVSKLFRTLGKRSKPKPSSALPEGSCRQFSLAEMKIATNNFDDKLLVGEGGFGRVYKGFIDDCNKTVAIKRLKLKPGQGLVYEDLRTEVVLLCQLRHPNLVPLIGYCIDEGENILVYEFIVNGNLFRKLYYTDHDDHDRLSWKERLRICIGVARALHYLHTRVKQTIIHGFC